MVTEYTRCTLCIACTCTQTNKELGQYQPYMPELANCWRGKEEAECEERGVVVCPKEAEPIICAWRLPGGGELLKPGLLTLLFTGEICKMIIQYN
jgi:hypothetical protein